MEMSSVRRDEDVYELEELLERPPCDVENGLTEVERHPRNKTEYLDGVRGLAALLVFIQHGISGFGMGMQEFGFGQDGYYAFANLPFIRIFFSGGNCAVSIFFILSGYVLSVAPLRKLKQGQSINRRLLSAAIRRPLRLYPAPLATSFIFAMLLHVPGPLVLPTPIIHPQESISAELAFYTAKTWDFFRLNRPHASYLFSYPYNVVMWTLPIELKGSFLVYGLLLILSSGVVGKDHRVPLMVGCLLFAAAVIMLQNAFYWSMAAFLLGVMLALVDTWPAIETQISNVVESRPHWLRLPAPLGVRKRLASMTAKVAPRWFLDRWSTTFASTDDTETTFHYLCFWVGWYLLAQPSHAGDINYSGKAWGWGWLTKLIPKEYSDIPYYRYWQTYGALLMIYAILRISWLQRFFSTRPLRFLGKVSFMMYLVHPCWFRIFGDRVVGLVGNSVDPHLFGSFWDKGLAWIVPDIGPMAVGLRFWVWLALTLPTTLFVSWGCMKLFDEPSVRLGYWVVKKIGLEQEAKA